MISAFDNYLISDIKSMPLSYEPQVGNWKGEHHRKNRIKRIVTITRVWVDNNTIDALIQEWEGHPRSHTMDALSLVDTKKITFVDEELAQHLKSLKSD